MAPLQIILLLLIVRLPRSLQISAPAGEAPLIAPLVHVRPAIVLLLFLAAHLALVLFMLQRTRSALRMLNEPSASGVAVTARTDSLFQRIRWATIGITALFIYVLGLPAAVEAWLGSARHVPLLPETLYLIPPLVTWVATWAASYRVESANHERSLAYRFAAGMPAHAMPTLGQFMAMQIRHNFYLLIPAAVVTLVEEEAGWLDGRFPNAGEWGMVLAVGCLLLLMPWYMTRAWGTAPLTGPLREKLDGVARRYRLRFRNIIIWNTHHSITNAAIVGYLPFVRYFLMTDALLETLTDKQIEAVFAHEVGHGVHRHLWWYLIGIVSALMLSSSVTDVAMAHLPEKWFGGMGGADVAGSVIGLALVAAFLVMGFPFISRRFEHQADWFASRHMASAASAAADGEELFEAGLPAALHVSKPALQEARSSEAAASAPVLIPAITLDQYVAGQYLHAQAPGAFTPGAPGAPAAHTSEACPMAGVARPEPSAAGAETFISALDAIADLAHRSRDRRGWMHPSINQRMSLLRALATDASALENFDRRMIRTRLWLVGLVLLAIGATVYDYRHPPVAQTGPGQTAAGRQIAGTAPAFLSAPAFLPRRSAMFKVTCAS